MSEGQKIEPTPAELKERRPMPLHKWKPRQPLQKTDTRTSELAKALCIAAFQEQQRQLETRRQKLYTWVNANYWREQKDLYEKLLDFAREFKPKEEAAEEKPHRGRHPLTYISEGVFMISQGRTRKEILEHPSIKPHIKPKIGESKKDAQERYWKSTTRRAKRKANNGKTSCG